jgi:predicted nucleic acid-binding protein
MGRPPNTTPEAYADANLLISFLAGRGHPFYTAAAGLMERVDRGEVRLIVTAIVVAEVVWSAPSALGRSRSETAGILLDVIESDGIEVPERAVIRRALELQVGLPRLDLADAYLAASALLVGPATIASFDADLDAIDGVERLVA